MGKILSQEEIDALLVSAGEIDRASRGRDVNADSVITYNFRRPDRVSKEQMRSLHFLHDRFARNVSTSLSAYLRAVTDVMIVSVEQFTYAEFLMSLPDPTAFYALSMQPFDGHGALEMNPNIAFSLIDRMLGGSGQGMTTNRALTEIEQNVIDGVVKLLLENLSEGWSPITKVNFRISGRETRPQMLQVAAPTEVVILLVFDLRVGEERGMVNLCIPASVIESAGTNFAQGWQRTHREANPVDRKRLLDNLMRMPLPVTARLDTKIAAGELLEVRPGDVISLGRTIREPVDVQVGSLVKFEGRLVRSGDSSGVTLVEARESA